MAWRPEEHTKFLNTLDSAERVVAAFYRCLMALLIGGIIFITVWVFTRKSLGAGNQGEYFYFAIFALCGSGWAVSQFIQARPRPSRIQLPKLRVETDAVEDGRAWKFEIGSTSDAPAASDATVATFSRSFSIPLASLPADLLPNEQSLACLESELTRGSDVDSACRMIQPAYENWSMLQRRAYQMYVQHALAARRRPSEPEA